MARGDVGPEERRKAGLRYGSGTWAAFEAAALACLVYAFFAFAAPIAPGMVLERALGLSLLAVVIVTWSTTPRLGHTRLSFLELVPFVKHVVGMTTLGAIAASAFLLLPELFPADAPAAIRGVAALLFGVWVLRAAWRLRVARLRLHGLLAAGLLLGLGGAAAGLAGRLPGDAAVLALVPRLVAGALLVLGTWFHALATALPGRVVGATFALPGIDATALPADVVRREPARRGAPASATRASRPDAATTGSRPPRDVRSPVRFGREELARRTGLDVAALEAHRPAYRTVRVPKRAGGGTRELRVPDPATKALQRRLLHRLLDGVPVHPAAHGFERGRSTVSNAALHAGKAVVVKMDIVDFFGTTSPWRVRRLFRVLGWDAATAALLTSLVTDQGCLPQGAPTSPRLANLVNVRLDARLAGLARALGATYTRYADDLTFSFDRDDHAALADLLGATRRIVRDEGYRLHEGRKLQIRRRHHRQVVTGLVVNEHVGLSRATRRWLRAVEHHRLTGRPTTIDEAALRGWQAYELMVEAGAPPSA